LILLLAVATGVLCGWGISKGQNQNWQPPVFQAIWLAILGFLPQLIAFYMPFTRRWLTTEWASICLVSSQLLLLAFAIRNLHLPGMAVLSFGLSCNLIVILGNGGFMPLPLETATKLVDRSVLELLHVGERVSNASKDILLPESRTIFPWLADRFLPPSFLPYRFAFSLGDVFVAMGAFWLLAGRQIITIPKIVGDI
jgi:hypothetical protein